VPVSDGCGEVVAVGEGVRRVRPGERVAPTFFQNWICGEAPADVHRSALGGPNDGCLEEYKLLDAQGVVLAPPHLSDAEVATLPCAGLTAWRAVVIDARVKPGDSVLVQGTGGVALFALQFAKMNGCEVILTSSSDEKLERARALGADHLINYRSHPDWSAQVRRLRPEGVDLVIELGGAGTLGESLKSVRNGGHVAIIGVLAGAAKELAIFDIIRSRARLEGVSVGNRDEFEAMCRAIALHHMHPVIDRVFPMERAVEALELMAAGGHFGKICLEI
jgi:NADPH:quinone reductase-like Zn-dependent oxidoreductase